MPMHLREMRMALTIRLGSSSMRTTSAASMAASLPMAPMAMPISARVSTGASLMPSPTKASFSFSPFAASSFSTSATLSAGSSSARTSSTPSPAATSSATRCASPVSMTVFFTPHFFSAATASAACGFGTSEITIWPAYFPSIAIWMTVPALRHSIGSMPRRCMSFVLPAATVCPSTTAVTPWPLISPISDTRLRSISPP